MTSEELFQCLTCKGKPFTKTEKIGFEKKFDLCIRGGHTVVPCQKSERFFQCVTHDAGPWGEFELGSDGKSIVAFHKSLGCEVVEYLEKKPESSLKDGVVEDKEKTLDFEDYKYLQEVENEIWEENEKDREIEHVSKYTTEEIVRFAEKLFSDSYISTNDSSKLYSIIKINDHYETIDFDSTDSQDILISNFRNTTKKFISYHQAENILRLIKSEKRMKKDTPRKSTYIRCAFVNNVLYYDLSNQNREIVVISKDEKKIIDYDKTSPIFIRTSSTSEQIKPNLFYQGNPIDKLFKILRKDNDIVFKCNILCLFLEHISVPMPLFDGNTNVGKTLTSAVIKMLIDPSGSNVEDNVTSMPTKPDDFATLMYCNYLVILENISNISNDQSDNLCRAVTGASFSSRMFYKQGTDKKMSYRRKIILNGITVPIERDDLARRVLPYDLSPFSKGEKRTDSEILKELYELLPDVLGQIFDTLQKALKLYDEVRNKTEIGFRGDFEIWGEAVSQALWNEPNKFLDALKTKELINNEKLSQNNCLVPYLHDLFNREENLENYVCSVTDFFNDFKEFAGNNGLDIKNKESFPSSVGKLSDIVKRSSTLLNKNSFQIKFRETTKKESHNGKQYHPNTKLIEIEKIKEVLFV